MRSTPSLRSFPNVAFESNPVLVRLTMAPPVPSNLCTPLIAVSTAVQSKVTKTVSVRKTTVETRSEGLSSSENPAPSPSALDLACVSRMKDAEVDVKSVA